MVLNDLEFSSVPTKQYVQGAFTIELRVDDVLVPRNLFDIRKMIGFVTIVDEMNVVQHFPVKVHQSSTASTSVFRVSVHSQNFAVGDIRVIATAYGPHKRPIFIRELYTILGDLQ